MILTESDPQHPPAMGIDGLWKFVEAVAEEVSLHYLAVEQGFVLNVGGIRCFRVGVDASGWIHRAMYRHSTSKNPELATLYARCCRLLESPVKASFFFDGPKRSNVKRGKQVRGNPHWIEQDFKKMVKLFGWQVVDAPAEADAELVRHLQLGAIDVIASEDSDLLVLGATAVLRNFAEVDGDEKARLYRADDIAQHPSLQLNTAGLVLIALLAGGDYSDGLKGCGIQTAAGLAKAGYGESLVRELLSRNSKTKQFLATWRRDLCEELRTNSLGFLPSRQPALAQSVPPDFPDLQVADYYLDPVVSAVKPPSLVEHSLNPAALAVFAEDHFSWGDTAGILAHFSTTIFPALAMSHLYTVARETDLGLPRKPCMYMVEVLQHRVTGRSLHPRHPEFRVSCRMDDALIDDVIRTVKGTLNDKETTSKVQFWRGTLHPKLRAWLPIVMIRDTYPELIVAAGRKNNPSSKQRNEPSSSASAASLAKDKQRRNTIAFIDLTGPAGDIFEPMVSQPSQEGLRMNDGRDREHAIELDTDSGEE